MYVDVLFIYINLYIYIYLCEDLFRCHCEESSSRFTTTEALAHDWFRPERLGTISEGSTASRESSAGSELTPKSFPRF